VITAALSWAKEEHVPTMLSTSIIIRFMGF
jgi:hypothetical protein